MNQIERISHMEAIMDKSERVLEKLRTALDAFKAAEAELDELENYYSNDLWREDFDADSQGKLPHDLKRGVLSEDGIWNLLAERDDLIYEMKNIIKKHED